MEFKAIVDATRRANPRAAPSSACTRTAILGVAARNIDAQIGGLIAQLQSGGDFAAKVGDTLLLPRPAGAACERVLLVGLGPRAGFGRKQYRKALQASAQALAKTGASDALVYLALEAVAGRRDAIPRTDGGGDLLRANLQDSRPEDRDEAKAGQARQRQRGGGERARGEGCGGWPQDRRRHRQRARLVARSGEPAAQHLYAHLSRATRRNACQGVAAHQDQGARRERHQGLEDGCIARGHPGLCAAAAADRLRVSRRQQEQRADMPRSARALPSIRAGFRSRIRPPWTR